MSRAVQQCCTAAHIRCVRVCSKSVSSHLRVHVLVNHFPGRLRTKLCFSGMVKQTWCYVETFSDMAVTLGSLLLIAQGIMGITVRPREAFTSDPPPLPSWLPGHAPSTFRPIPVPVLSLSVRNMLQVHRRDSA